jgi:divalent metal cation (Fe/Co/Zn/Cd) transporter
MRVETLSVRLGEPRALAIALLWITVGWNVIEGVIAISSGVAAGSIALVGFGLDSFIEVTAAGILLWRMGLPADDEQAEARESLAHRVVGVTFFVLAAYIVVQATYSLATASHPESSTVGIVLAAVSLVVMPAVGLAKRWNARRLGSRALIAESTETLVCSYLSLTLFVGLAANALFGWWWADVLAAIAMAPWIVKEGLEGVRGDACAAD